MIISFDPGYSTGIALINNVNYAERTYDLSTCGVVMFPDRAKLATLLKRYSEQLEQIVIEDFLLFEHKALAQIGSRFEAVKVIERITVYAEQLGLANRITMQIPALKDQVLRNGNRTMPKAHYQTIQQLPERHRPHVISAYRHARYFIWTHKQGVKNVS